MPPTGTASILKLEESPPKESKRLPSRADVREAAAGMLRDLADRAEDQA